ncbi:acyl-CoA N-acyltransferase [Deinococcus maricopensis]|uniref:N-acetyltransferase domain-containing protein n=1 Tax=Deinococcus maricopensis (strain DSM 21211 / LMG 22137 / NRRL B-23946 / LB-34) TaxID=709986 RepID=E8U4G8_DEIML|nr:acyl-CoA N-acyltransferase [Deinococcus maricopensis]ADV68833.1 hypothetical protein Deima_3205 [Deinococcus maricopensis DSM 21211]
MTAPYTIRDVTDPAAFRALETVQIAAWGYADREVLPGTMLRISAATGGIVLGAYPVGEDVPFGLAYGFPALHGDAWWHHSHLLAVDPAWRGSGAAVALKHAQRERALAQGLTRMTWTFDPLIARNARLNLGKLGARAVSYHPGWYDLGGVVPADRLMIEWDLTRTFVPHAPREPDGAYALQADGPLPGTPDLTLTADHVLVEVPTDSDARPETERLAWRLALRDTLMPYLVYGYAVTDLARAGERAYYVLSRDA